MKTIYLSLFVLSTLLISCGSSKKFQAAVPEDKALFNAINDLVKKPDNPKAQDNFTFLYKQTVDRHEDALNAYASGQDMGKWDKMLRELNALQQIYNTLQAVPGNLGVSRPTSYLSRIESVKASAAEDYYQRAAALLKGGGRNNALQAYDYFKTANGYVTGYKDVQTRMNAAYDSAIVEVVINPISEQGLYYANNSSSSADMYYNPEDFQMALVRDLGGISASKAPARFYSSSQAATQNIRSDWDLNLLWKQVETPHGTSRQYSKEVSKQVEAGKDSAGKKIYQTVNATLYISEEVYMANGALQYTMTDAASGSVLGQDVLADQVSWTQRRASYKGDSRALSEEDWAMVNNRDFVLPVKGQVMNGLLDKIYPVLLQRIEAMVK